MFTLELLRAPGEQALTSLTDLVERGNEIIIVDSETREDLLLAKELFSLLPRKVLYVGAAGFFHAVGTDVHRHARPALSESMRILFVTGSMMKTSKKQCDHLVSSGYLERTFPVISREAVSHETMEIRRVSEAVSRSSYTHRQLSFIPIGTVMR